LGSRGVQRRATSPFPYDPVGTATPRARSSRPARRATRRAGPGL